MSTGRFQTLPMLAATMALAVGSSTTALAGAGTWTTNGPYGGIVNTLVVDPKNPATLYAASPIGGVFKSTDRGVKWARIDNGLTDPSAFILAMHPSNPAVLYTGGGSGIFRTVNAGKSWAQISDLVNVRQIVIDPKTPAILYAVVDQGPLYRSTNSGKTWTSLFNNLKSQSIVTLAIDPENSDTLYAGATGDPTSSTPGGVYKSINGGKSWTLSTKGLGTGFITVSQIWINQATPNTLFAVDAGLKKSIDGGKSWAAVKTNNTNVTAFARDPEKPAIFYGADYFGTIYSTANSGVTWKALPSITSPAFQGNIRTVAVDPTSSERLFTGTDHGVFTSANQGKSWSEINQGLANTAVTALAIDPKAPDTLYAGTEYSGIFKTTNGGGAWTRVYDDWMDKAVSLVVNPVDPSTLYYGSNFGKGIFKSTNSGVTWTNPVTYTTVLSLALDPTTPSTLYYGGGSKSIYKSINSGKSWAASGTGLPSGLSPGSVSASGQTVVLTDPNAGLFLSGNGGKSWAANDPTVSDRAGLSSPRILPQATEPFYNLAVGIVEGAAFEYVGVATPKGDIYGFARGVAKGSGATADTGATTQWTPWAAPTGVKAGSCAPISTIAADPVNLATFYAGGTCGVLRGTGEGKTLAAMNSGLPLNVPIDALAIAPSGRSIYAAAYGGGVYSYTVP